MTLSPIRALFPLALALACAGPAQAQSLAGPRPSALWLHAAGSDSAESHVRPETSPAARGFLIGGVIGALAGGLAGHRICRVYGAGPDGCTGQTLWWAAVAGMLGGLIGASSASEADR